MSCCTLSGAPAQDLSVKSLAARNICATTVNICGTLTANSILIPNLSGQFVQVNAEGVAGPIGPSGLIGPAGQIGAAGISGVIGPAGLVGPAGSIGADGISGTIGPAGLVGPAGSIGADGIQGIIGPAGLIGPAGAIGPQGITGQIGPDGLSIIGPTGPIGSIGPMGIQGIAGPAGIQGAILSGMYARMGAQPATIAAGARFTLDRTVLASPVVIPTTDASGTIFQLINIGRYEINYQVFYPTDGSVALYAGPTLVTMLPLDYTLLGKQNAGDVTGSVIIETTTPNSFLSLNAAAGNSAAIQPGPNASTTNQNVTTLSIKQL